MISLLHPTARQEKYWAVCADWYGKSDCPSQVEYVLVPEPKDFTLSQGELYLSIPFGRKLVIPNNGRPCLVDGFNLAASESRGDVLVVIADDFFCFPHWDTDLLRVLGGKIDQPVAVWASTGGDNDRHFIVHPILTRAYYLRYGFLFWPEYEAWYADNEFYEVAKRDGVILDARAMLKFDHRHYSRGQAPHDAIYQRQELRAQEARQLYERRKAAGFPGHGGY